MDWILERYSPASKPEFYDKLYGNFVLYCISSAMNSFVLWKEDICQLDKLFDAVKEFLRPSKSHFDSICLAAKFIDDHTGGFIEIGLYPQFQFYNVKWQTNPDETDAAALLYLLLLSESSPPVLARRFLEQEDDRSFLSTRLNFMFPVWHVFFEETDIVDIFYEFNGSIIEIMAQLASNNSDAFKLMLDYGVGHFDPSNILLSYIGSQYEDTTLLLQLLQVGADPNVKGYRVTPLQIATFSWDYNGVEILLQAGADPSFTGDINGVEWEARTLLSRFNDLHGSSPLYICRNFDCIFQDRIKEERESNVKGIESLLLKYGGIEIKGCRGKYENKGGCLGETYVGIHLKTDFTSE